MSKYYLEIRNQIISVLEREFKLNPVPLHEPAFTGNEAQYLMQCLDTKMVSSIGPFVQQFERLLCDYTGAEYAVATMNGTSALHLALLTAGIKANEEVLVPALSFVATANAVSYCGAIPHFVDSQEETLGLDPIKLREYLSKTVISDQGFSKNKLTGRIIKAVVPMHAFGHPIDILELIKLAEEFNLIVIEDAAESLGSLHNGKHTGTFAAAGILSFNGNKIITTGGGGAILTNNYDLYQRAKHKSTTSKLPHAWRYEHNEIGFNYRMPNINAALGCAQLENIEMKIKAKRELYEKYLVSFKNIEGLKLFSEPLQSRSNYWLQTILLDDTTLKFREMLLEDLNQAGFGSRPAWDLLCNLNPYKSCPTMDLSISMNLYDRLINIPSSVAV